MFVFDKSPVRPMLACFALLYSTTTLAQPAIEAGDLPSPVKKIEPDNASEEAPPDEAPDNQGTYPIVAPREPVNIPAEVAKDSEKVFRHVLADTYRDNPRIIAERQGFEETGEQFNQALAGWLPTINASYGRGRRRNRLDNEPFEYFDAEEKTVRFSQPLVDLQVYFELDSADDTVKARGAQLVSVTQDVLLQGIEAYINTVRDQQILKLSRNNVKVLKRSRERTRERFKFGEATKTDFSQSKARVSRAESDVIQAVASLAISRARFERIVGYKPEQTLSYPSTLPDVPESLDAVLDKALRKNPRIISARFSEKSAAEAVKANKADLLPTVSLDASTSRAEGSGLFGANIDTEDVIVNITLPLYRGGSQYSRIRRLQSQQSRRKYELRDITNEIREQTVGIWERYVTSQANIKAQKDTIRAAEIALEGVKAEQIYGTRSVLDVLDAEQELFVAKVELARAIQEKKVAMYNLLAIMGELSPARLGLGIDAYSTKETYDDIKYQFIGF